MSNNSKGLSIIIPVYNEEIYIKQTIQDVNRVMIKSKIEFEIIVVNDGSIDATRQILKNIEIPIEVIEHQNNRGYGRSIKTGISTSNYEYIAITDADGTYPNNELLNMYNEIHNYDMVVGQRSQKNLPNIRRPAKWILLKLANFLVNYHIPDLNSGLRIFKRDIAIKFFPIICDGFSFTSTITLAMLTNNYTIKYYPIGYHKRKGKSKIKPIRDTLNFLQLIIMTVLYFDPLKIFIPISVLLLLISIIVFLVSLFVLPKILDTTVIIFFISSIQILAIGMLADLIDKRLKK